MGHKLKQTDVREVAKAFATAAQRLEKNPNDSDVILKAFLKVLDQSAAARALMDGFLTQKPDKVKGLTEWQAIIFVAGISLGWIAHEEFSGTVLGELANAAN